MTPEELAFERGETHARLKSIEEYLQRIDTRLESLERHNGRTNRISRTDVAAGGSVIGVGTLIILKVLDLLSGASVSYPGTLPF